MTSAAVLITGASGGVGSALCEEFRKAGYFVIGTDLPGVTPSGFAHAFVACDLERLANEEKYALDFFRTTFEILDENESNLKVMVNNAAVQLLGDLHSISRAAWGSSLSVNVGAPMFLTQGFLERLEASEGLVINIGSIHARLTKPGFIAYATSKAALAGLTRALSVSVGSRIRVLAIEPAALDTELLRAGFAEGKVTIEDVARHHPQGRIGGALEVAKLSVLLSRPGAEFLHGSVIGVDGGISNRLHDPA